MLPNDDRHTGVSSSVSTGYQRAIRDEEGWYDLAQRAARLRQLAAQQSGTTERARAITEAFRRDNLAQAVSQLIMALRETPDDPRLLTLCVDQARALLLVDRAADALSVAWGGIWYGQGSQLKTLRYLSSIAEIHDGCERGDRYRVKSAAARLASQSGLPEQLNEGEAGEAANRLRVMVKQDLEATFRQAWIEQDDQDIVRVDELSRQLFPDSMIEPIREQQREHERLRSEFMLMIADHAQIQRKIQELAGERDELVADRNRLVAERDEAQVTYDALQDTIRKQTAQSNELRRQLIDMESRHTALQREHAVLQPEIKALNGQRVELEEAIGGLNAERNRLLKEIGPQRAARNGLHADIENMTAIRSGLYADIENMTTIRNGLDVAINGLHARRDKLRGEITSLLTESDMLQQKRTMFQENVDKLQDRFNELKRRSNKLEVELTVQEDQRANLQNEIGKLLQQIQRRKAELLEDTGWWVGDWRKRLKDWWSQSPWPNSLALIIYGFVLILLLIIGLPFFRQLDLSMLTNRPAAERATAQVLVGTIPTAALQTSAERATAQVDGTPVGTIPTAALQTSVEPPLTQLDLGAVREIDGWRYTLPDQISAFIFSPPDAQNPQRLTVVVRMQVWNTHGEPRVLPPNFFDLRLNSGQVAERQDPPREATANLATTDLTDMDVIVGGNQPRYVWLFFTVDHQPETIALVAAQSPSEKWILKLINLSNVQGESPPSQKTVSLNNWLYDYPEPNGFRVFDQFGSRLPQSDHRFIAVRINVVNQTGTAQPLPPAFLVLRDSEGRVSLPIRTDDSAPTLGLASDFAWGRDVLMEGGTEVNGADGRMAMVLYFEVTGDAKKLVLFAPQKPEIGWVIVESL
jgi:uncharacterized coiled-coil DUF342 family protein